MTKILLVDDSGFSRRMIKNTLGEGYSYIEAASGEAGLDLFIDSNPDLVILDLTMPGMNGLEVLERIKEIDPSARVIIGSADIQEYNRLRALELGALGFVNKPFQDSLVTLVRTVLFEGQ